jgi:predicted methyltransferase
MRHPILLTVAALTAVFSYSAATAKPVGYVAKAVADPRRPADDRAADAKRKPAATLALSGVKPGMTVGEFYPAGGYYTRLLSDVVGPAGHVYSFGNAGWGEKGLQGNWKNVSFDSGPFGTVRFPKPLDVAWITQNYHDLKVPEFGKIDTVAFDRAVYAALKPGGIYFIIDHQGRPGMTSADFAKLHRIDRALVVREVTSAGFKLAAEGNFLRNSADDHAAPIFDKSIQGHTDQFVLKFIKPRS